MLENLVESKNNSRAVRKFYGFLFSTFLVVTVILLSATLWSLFAKDFVMGDGDMELSNLLTPIPVAADEPPPPEPEKPRQQNEPQKTKAQITSRQTNMARVDESPIAPDKVSVAPNAFKARPQGYFQLNPNAAETDASLTSDTGRGLKNGVEGSFKDSGNQSTAVETVRPKTPPPVIKKAEENKKAPEKISLGVVNGKATSLSKPPYPPSARAVGASGTVNVQVTIDEQGNVISARAVSGHVLLRDAAERAARAARFTPTYLSERAVKVNGLIVYNFTK